VDGGGRHQDQKLPSCHAAQCPEGHVLGAFFDARTPAWLRLPGDRLFGGGLPLYKRQFDLHRWRDFQTIRDRAEPRKCTDGENSMAKTKKSKSIRKSKRNRPAQLESQDCMQGLSVVHPKAAGIDAGNEHHWVAIPPSLDPEPVRRFSCFTWDFDSPGELAEEPWH